MIPLVENHMLDINMAGFPLHSTAHLNGLIYKDLILKEIKWVWVVALRQGDLTLMIYNFCEV